MTTPDPHARLIAALTKQTHELARYTAAVQANTEGVVMLAQAVQTLAEAIISGDPPLDSADFDGTQQEPVQEPSAPKPNKWDQETL